MWWGCWFPSFSLETEDKTGKTWFFFLLVWFLLLTFSVVVSVHIQLHGCHCSIGIGFDLTGCGVLLSAYCVLAPGPSSLLAGDVRTFLLSPMIMMLGCYAVSVESTRGQKGAFPGPSVFWEQVFVVHSGHQCAAPLLRHLSKAPQESELPMSLASGHFSESWLALCNKILISALLGGGALACSFHPWVFYPSPGNIHAIPLFFRLFFAP